LESAQLRAWNATRVGTLGAELDSARRRLANEALSIAMLERRAAVASRVVAHFVARIGQVGGTPCFEALMAGGANADRALTSAKEALALAEEISPGNPAVAYERAIVSDLAGDKSAALADLRSVTEKNPRFTDAVQRRAALELEVGDSNAAYATLNAVGTESRIMRQLAKTWARVLRALGDHVGAGKWDKYGVLGTMQHETQGNECYPFSLDGEILTHPGMRPALIIAGDAFGRALMNDRGVLYWAPPPMSRASLSHFVRNVIKPTRPVSSRFGKLVRIVGRNANAMVNTLVFFAAAHIAFPLWKVMPAKFRTWSHEAFLPYLIPIVYRGLGNAIRARRASAKLESGESIVSSYLTRIEFNLITDEKSLANASLTTVDIAAERRTTKSK
jgi:hypothetical protein